MFFLELSCFFHDPTDVGNLISGCSAFSKTSLNIRKFTVHILLKPENFEHYFTSIWDECNYAVLWAFFGIAFLGNWNENWPFPVLWPLLSIPNLLAYWVQHFHSIIFHGLKQLNWRSITSTSFAHSDAFRRPTWLHIPGCLALDEWSYHHDYLGREDLFCTVLPCILATLQTDALPFEPPGKPSLNSVIWNSETCLKPYPHCPPSSILEDWISYPILTFKFILFFKA